MTSQRNKLANIVDDPLADALRAARKWPMRIGECRTAERPDPHGNIAKPADGSVPSDKKQNREATYLKIHNPALASF
jgi:hypothetical protein